MHGSESPFRLQWHPNGIRGMAASAAFVNPANRRVVCGSEGSKDARDFGTGYGPDSSRTTVDAVIESHLANQPATDDRQTHQFVQRRSVRRDSGRPVATGTDRRRPISAISHAGQCDSEYSRFDGWRNCLSASSGSLARFRRCQRHVDVGRNCGQPSSGRYDLPLRGHAVPNHVWWRSATGWLIWLSNDRRECGTDSRRGRVGQTIEQQSRGGHQCVLRGNSGGR